MALEELQFGGDARRDGRQQRFGHLARPREEGRPVVPHRLPHVLDPVATHTFRPWFTRHQNTLQE